jgi:hypothetical protein
MFFTLTLLNRYDYRVNQSQIQITIHYFLLSLYINRLKYVKNNLNYFHIPTGNDTQITPHLAMHNGWISPRLSSQNIQMKRSNIPSYQTPLRHTLSIWRSMIDKLNQLITHTHTVPLSLPPGARTRTENHVLHARSVGNWPVLQSATADGCRWRLHRNQRAMEVACMSRGKGRGKRGDPLQPHNNLDMSLGCLCGLVRMRITRWNA